MPFLFKIKALLKTLITFSLTVILKVRILEIPKLSRHGKGYLISHKTFEERGNIRKIKLHMQTV